MRVEDLTLWRRQWRTWDEFRRYKCFKSANTDENMHSEKKITKEDTWRTADLKRHIRGSTYDDGYMRKRDDSERKHGGGESTERRHGDPEESRRDRDKLRERETTRDRRDGDKYLERRKEGSQDRRGDRDRRDDRDRKDDRDRERRKQVDGRENREKRPDRKETYDKERYRDKEKERVRDRERERHIDEDRDKRRENRDKEKRREERDGDHRSERRQHEESLRERRGESENQLKEHRDQRHSDNYEDRRKDKDNQERHVDRNHSERKEEREYKEEHRRHREERDRRHRDGGHHDEKRRHDSDHRKPLELKPSAGNVKHAHGERDKNKERWKKEEEHVDRRYKEKKRREEEDLGKNHQEIISSTALSSEESRRHEKKKETKVDNDEDLAEQEYEDDFEDYEDDFDEVDESEDEKDAVVVDEKGELTAQQRKEIELIQRAMAEENERGLTTQSMSRDGEDGSKWSKDSEKNPIKASQSGKCINFVAAKQREVSKKVATKQKKRSTELLRLIDLDFSTTFPLLDLPPVSEYEMYIKNFGNANTKQAYVQCNEDNADRDIQTEDIEMCEKWTQHPPEHNGAFGDPNSSQEARDKSRTELNFESQRLTSFLHSASQVMLVLLEEDQAERKSLRKLKTQTESLSFSDGSLQLNTKLPFLLGRQISLVHFSQVQRHSMLSVHLPTTKASAVRLDSGTIICVWNIWEPSRPQKMLLYESEVLCCCFSPRKSTLVFAGTSVGSVVLWDLREQTSNHYSFKIGEDEWTFRQPTFSTDAVMAGSGHFSSVTSVEVVSSTVAGRLSSEVPLLASEEETSGLSFQLASLDESGLLNFWVVLELPKGNEAGSPTDLGLRPGGKVKLLHSSALLTADRTRDAAKTGPIQTLLLKFLPTDSNQFFIGTNLGLVSHGTSHGLKAPPKSYRFQDVEERAVDVTSISFSPFRPHLFLVGCGDGSIRLHAVSQDRPVAEWRTSTAGEPVVSLQWAQTRPTVFCVLDAASNIYIWDLLKSNAQPLVTERIHADRVTTVSVFGDSGQQNTYSGVALAHESGKLELHYFTRSLSVSSSAEEGKLESFLTEAF